MGLPRNLLTIDCGFGTTAWADWHGHISPQVGEFKLPRHVNMLEDSLNFMCNRFREVLEEMDPRKVILEGAELWVGSLKSQTSAARGDLFKLAYLVGAYAGICIEQGVSFEIVVATAWKGTLSKEGTALRVERITGARYPSEHTTDAVAMGLARDKEIWHLQKEVR